MWEGCGRVVVGVWEECGRGVRVWEGCGRDVGGIHGRYVGGMWEGCGRDVGQADLKPEFKSQKCQTHSVLYVCRIVTCENGSLL